MPEPSQAQTSTASSSNISQEGSGQARQLAGRTAPIIISILAVGMSVFQLYTGFYGELPGAKQLSIHLTFALLLCYLIFSSRKKKMQGKIPWYDLLLALIAGGCALYVFLNYEHVAYSVGRAAWYDLLIGGSLIALILEATRRSVSPMLPIICIIFLIYAYIGPYIPGELAHRGFGVSRIIDHIFMTGEGLWGVPLRVSATFVFLFVLFGAFLEKMGAGEYLIDLSFASMGRFRGGPAKAAVVASGAMGSISGSSIANTVTTGSMTIPLMKKVGFKPHAAGAVEVAASTNGQLMPPIMGAAAFIMAEMIGISYFEVVKAAIIPAILSYTAIFSIVHLEAVKENIRGLTKKETPPLLKTLISGIHYLIPLLVLIWLLLVWFWTPTTSAAWAILTAVGVIVLNNLYRHYLSYPRKLKGKEEIVQGSAYEAYQRNPTNYALRRTVYEIFASLETGAKNMAGIAAACASCGIIIGVVTLTGLGLKMATLISAAAGDSLFLALLFSVFACIILGMGLPTTATYIIMAAMTAPAILHISENMGAGLSIIAVHLFVFYYGIVADDTPPVGLCAYAAAGIAGSDPVKTGLKSFRLDLAAFTLPFMFIYNPKLLMMNTNALELSYILPMCILGMFCWSVFIQGYWLVKTFLWERFIYLILAFLLVNPSGVTLLEVHLPHYTVNFGSVACMALLFFWHRSRRQADSASLNYH